MTDPSDPISRAAVLDALRAVVAEAGEDYVYVRHYGDDVKSCTYVHDGQPDCIAGRVLARLGVPVDALARLDQAVESGIALAHPLLPVRLDDDAVSALAAAQSRQDCGVSWGRALAGAERVGT